MSNSIEKAKILFLMSGSIACYKACQLLSRLTQNGHSVQVVASKSALQFIGAPTIEGLTGNAVLSDLWQDGRMMDHIHLIRWADLVIAAPASANFINKMASGIGDDLLTTLFLAHDFKKPFLIAPAMNTAMYLHPVTQASVQKLSAMGIEVLETASGVLACGEVGSGRLLEPDLIQTEIEKRLQDLAPKTKIPNGLRVLVTAGGTQEAIDAVRVLTNKSTGKTGATISDVLFENGYEVHLLSAESAVKPQHSVSTSHFVTFRDLEAELQKLLSTQSFAAVIHAAAVSDFSIVNSKLGKWSSDENPTLEFQKNPKLVNQLRTWSINKNLRVIAFKMTASPNQTSIDESVRKLFTDSQADVVIQNDITEIDWKLNQHLFHWHQRSKKAKTLHSSRDLALEISEQLGGFQ